MTLLSNNYKYNTSNPSKYSTELENINNYENIIYDNSTWEKTSEPMKNMSLLQGLPLTIYSYAAGLLKSNNKYNLFGILDFFSYISKKNILGALNLRDDTIFTFLNKQNIIKGYIATYKNGLFGSAMNIFLNNNDFNSMDAVISENNNNNNNNNTNVYNNISKLNINGLTHPNYYKLDISNSCIILNEENLIINKSLIYGGCEFEQLAVILESLPNYNTDNHLITLPDTFLNHTIIFQYYIEPQYDKIISISNNLYSDLSNSLSNINNINNYNNIVKNYFGNNTNKINYSYCQALFLRKHKNVKKIYFPIIDSSGNYVSKTLPQFCAIYDSAFDDEKRKRKQAIYHYVMMPVKIGSIINNTYDFNYANQLSIEKNIRNSYSIYDYPLVPNIIPSIIGEYEIPNTWNFSTCYTILSGIDDYLSYKYLDYIKTYPTNNLRFGDNQTTIMHKIYLCNYDGNNECFKKVISANNNFFSLDFFNNIKKVSLVNSSKNLNVYTLLNNIISFVYNINEGKAVSKDVLHNNIYTYSCGIVSGIDCLLLLLTAQNYYNTNSRIFSSDEIFNVYYNLINNNNDYKNNKTILLNELLNNKYSINGSTIIDNSSNLLYTSLSDLSLNSDDKFFIYISDLLRRNLLSLNQKSYYKILQFNNTNYINKNNGELAINFNPDLITIDYNKIETLWNDVTYIVHTNANTNDLQELLGEINSLYSDFCKIYFANYESNGVKDLEKLAEAINNCILYFEIDNETLRDEFYNTLINNNIDILFNDTIANIYKYLIGSVGSLNEYYLNNVDISIFIAKSDIIKYFIKILLLFYLSHQEYILLGEILDTKYNYNNYYNNFNNLFNKKYKVLKLDKTKSFSYTLYKDLLNNLNFTVVDIFNTINNKYDLSNNAIFDISNLTYIKLFDNNTIIKLLKYIFVVTTLFYKNNLLKIFENLNSYINYFNNNDHNNDVINSDVYKILKKINNIRTKINSTTLLDDTSLTYRNNFISLNDDLRYKLFTGYFEIYF